MWKYNNINNILPEMVVKGQRRRTFFNPIIFTYHNLQKKKNQVLISIGTKTAL